LNETKGGQKSIMKRQVLINLVTLSCCMLLAGPALDSRASAQNGSATEAGTIQANSNSNGKAKVSIQRLLTFSGQTVIPGGASMLVRNGKDVYMSLHAAELTPGTVVTAWWVFFNNPKKCATTPCSVADLSNAEVQPSLVNATGRIVGADGTADFGAFKSVGDTTGAFTGSGLLNASKAEIHLVVRSHGPAILDDAQTLSQQLSIFNGGCPPNTCANLQVSIHQP
jgi:hypothetical protein